MAILDALPGVGSDLPWDRRLVKSNSGAAQMV
jgi:hypothetical protein